MPNADNVKAAVSDQDFEVLNNGGKKKEHHYHYHHHHRHSKKWKHDKRILSLLCDNVVIDKLVCRYKIPPPTIVYGQSAVEESQTPLEALNNGGGKIVNVFIVMDKPCSKDLPPLCSAAIQKAAQESEESEEPEDSGSHANADAKEEAEADKDTVIDTDVDVDTNTDDTDLWKKKHHHHHKHGKHHRHRHGKHHHNMHDHHGRKKPKHPYKDLCVAVGEFCGNSLYGCNFDFKTLYLCTAIGEKPVVVQRNAESCQGTDNGKCNCKSTNPVCGAQLDPECTADPSAIYHCPNGNGTKYEVLQICTPGTKCNTEKDGNAYCGSDTCNCTGTRQFCSHHFPERCGLQKNSIYRCTSTGAPEFVSSCGDSNACVTVTGGAICRSKECKCTVDGTVCGESFPPACRLHVTSLYSCKTGKPPILIKNCYPNYCASSIATKAVAMDRCSDSCLCPSKSKVCGSTFLTWCGLDKAALYKCDGSGSKPVLIEVCDKGCVVNAGDNSCAGKCQCPISANGKPVCGGNLDPSCNADSTVIYHCPNGDGSKPQILKKCLPGTQCNTDKDSNPNCGYSGCTCTRDVVACSEQFPTICKLDPNSVYKCNSSGVLELVKTCSDATECVSLVDGALCVNKDCKCTNDGNFCGNIFPIACRLSESTIYSCKKEQSPIPIKNCEPGTCSSSAATSQAATVF
ncbi:hypothetical protein BGZ81_001286, partial [Podila clonocystis]